MSSLSKPIKSVCVLYVTCAHFGTIDDDDDDDDGYFAQARVEGQKAEATYLGTH